MFNDFDYIKNKISDIPDVRAVYRVSGLSKLEELLRDIRDTEFPCIAVDSGVDGMLNLIDGFNDKSYRTIYVLFQVTERDGDSDTISSVIECARQIGVGIMKMMYSDSTDISSPCYGFDASSINYSTFGPLGMSCYGYSFGYTINRDNEFE